MNWLTPLLTLTIPIAGSVLIASLTYQNSRKAAIEAANRAQKITVYDNYIKAIQKFHRTPEEYQEIIASHSHEMTDAHFKLVTYASETVLDKVAEYKEILATSPINIERAVEAQGAIFLAIRSDIGLANGTLSARDVAVVAGSAGPRPTATTEGAPQ